MQADARPGRTAPQLRALLPLALAGLVALAAPTAVLPQQANEEIESALELYGMRLLQTGRRLGAFPSAALEKRLHGTATLDLRIAMNGTFRAGTLVRSSGHAVLDESALAMLERAVPLTEIPGPLQNKPFIVRVSVAFVLPD